MGDACRQCSRSVQEQSGQGGPAPMVPGRQHVQGAELRSLDYVERRACVEL